MSDLSVLKRVRWARVGLFYAIALGIAIAVVAVLYLLGQRDLSSGGSGPLALGLMALVYMPAPLIAALIVERLDGRGYGLRTIFARGWWRRLPRIAVVAVAVVAALILAMLAASWLAGNIVGLSGAGRLLFSHDDLVANIVSITNGSLDSTQVAAISAQVPANLWLLVGAAGLSAIVVGFTINGLFAFGEEYGWRGWLADELRGLGPIWANLIIGVAWGLWHAPLILLGYNYGSYRVVGVGFMVAWCVAASFLLWRARQVGGSVLVAAVIHGAINGFAGTFLIVLADTNPVLAAPVGIIGTACVAVVAALFWVATARLVRPQAIEEPSAAPTEALTPQS